MTLLPTYTISSDFGIVRFHFKSIESCNFKTKLVINSFERNERSSYMRVTALPIQTIPNEVIYLNFMVEF